MSGLRICGQGACWIVACAIVLLCASCDCQGDQSPTSKPAVTPAEALKSLKHPGALAQLYVPDEATLLGIDEEGLRVHIAIELPEERVQAFMNQELLRGHLARSLREKWPGAPDHPWPWWRPNDGDVLQRTGGWMPDNRWIQISVNRIQQGDSKEPRIRIYIYRFNT